MVLLTILIVATALLASLLGQGGGVLYTPVQVWLGVGFHTAATTSLFLIMVTSLSSTLVFRGAKRIDSPLALTLESSTAVGAFLGGFISGLVPVDVLFTMFAAVVSIAAVFMVADWHYTPRANAEGVRRNRILHWRRAVGGHVYEVNLAIGLPVSFIAGMASGLTGVGGGVLKVPMMVLLLGVPMEIAVGSSALMVGITAAGGFAGHVLNGHWDWRTSLLLAVAAFAGAQMGSKLSVNTNSRYLRKGFGWFLLLVAASMLARAVL